MEKYTPYQTRYFDEEVAARLKGCQERTVVGLDRFSQWMFNFFVMHGAKRVEPLEKYRFFKCSPEFKRNFISG